MKNFKKALKYIYVNRRIIGTVIGSALMLCGYSEEGSFVLRAGEQ